MIEMIKPRCMTNCASLIQRKNENKKWIALVSLKLQTIICFTVLIFCKSSFHAIVKVFQKKIKLKIKLRLRERNWCVKKGEKKNNNKLLMISSTFEYNWIALWRNLQPVKPAYLLCQQYQYPHQLLGSYSRHFLHRLKHKHKNQILKKIKTKTK